MRERFSEDERHRLELQQHYHHPHHDLQYVWHGRGRNRQLIAKGVMLTKAFETAPPVRVKVRQIGFGSPSVAEFRRCLAAARRRAEDKHRVKQRLSRWWDQ